MSDSPAIELFRTTVLEYYRQHGRPDLPWRQSGPDGGFDPYRILVSEIMLQQTQVARVVPKFTAFMERFPTSQALAASELAAVLTAWSGLGYNRRAKFLWQAAQQIGIAGGFPATPEELVALPGVGKNTAGAVLAYAFNQPAVFVETNIRTVYIHHFFADQRQVGDGAIRQLVGQTIAGHPDPRLFYWGLMDYGTHLKATVGNLSVLSKTYVKQGSFAGSRRQIRGQIIRLLSRNNLPYPALAAAIADERLGSVLAELEHEALIAKAGQTYKLA